jgi:hypothetical protein
MTHLTSHGKTCSFRLSVPRGLKKVIRQAIKKRRTTEKNITLKINLPVNISHLNKYTFWTIIDSQP